MAAAVAVARGGSEIGTMQWWTDYRTEDGDDAGYAGHAGGGGDCIVGVVEDAMKSATREIERLRTKGAGDQRLLD